MNKLYLLLPLFLLPGIGKWAMLRPGAGEVSPAPPRQAYAWWSPAIGCPDTVRINLGTDCQAILAPEIALSGYSLACVLGTAVRIVVSDSNPLNGDRIDGPGIFRFAAFLAPGASCGSFQSCQGIVVAEDKTPPVLTPPADIRIDSFCAFPESFFNNPASLVYGGKALMQDNCSAAPDTVTQFRDVIVYDNRCDTVQLRRTFRGRDRAGNFTEAVQQIALVRPSLSDIQIVANVLLDTGCGQALAVGANGNISPTVSGFPFIVTGIRDTALLSPGGACGFSADYRDERFTLCRNTQKIIRYWTIFDWCRQEQRSLEQHITMGDLTPPMATCPAILDTLRVSVSPFDCRAALEIPAPVVKEACGAYSWAAEIWVDTVRWIPSGSGMPMRIPDTFRVAQVPFRAVSRIVTGIPAGCHRLVYTVMDECQNKTTITCRICVSDLISPIAISQNRVNISLDGGGFARLLPSDLDKGSRDNCGLVALEVRRRFDADSLTCTPTAPFFSSWGPEVFFSCCDAGKNISLELRATDASGNYNSTQATVSVEDKIAPACFAPKDISVNCLDLPPGFAPNDSLFLANAFGNPVVSDNCSATFIALPPVIQIEQCGSGTIKRQFQAVDKAGNRSGNVCVQTITLEKAHRYAIRFPKDVEFQCGKTQPETALTFGSGCDLLAVKVSEKQYTGNGKTCKQIYRTFDVINWCEYDGTQAPVEIPRDVDCNGVAGDNDVWVLVRPDGSSYLDADDNERNNFPAAGTRGAGCSGTSNPLGYWTSHSLDPTIRSRGIWRYTQVISVQDTIPPRIIMEKEVTVCLEKGDCSANVLLSVGLEETCSQDAQVSLQLKEQIREDSFFAVTEWERFGRYPKYLFSGVLMAGSYLIEVQAKDGCGNRAVREIQLKVVDCTNPTLVCVEGLSTQLSPLYPALDVNGDKVPDRASATVWVSDFIKRASDDCSNPLRYSINRVGEPVDINNSSLVLTCKDRGFLPVEVHAWDNAKNPGAPDTDGRNKSTCISHILVQDDPGSSCVIAASNGYGIGGRLRSENGTPLIGAEIYLNGGNSSAKTDGQGLFYFGGLKEGGDFSIFPTKTDVASSGVTTYDLLILTQHILGIRPLSSPYTLIAADVNMSGSATTMDVVLLRRLILNFDERFSHGKTWRFIDAGTRFANPANPWKTLFSEVRNFNNLRSVIRDADFVAVKIGDLNQSAPAFQRPGDFSPRSANRQAGLLAIPEMELLPGMEVEIPVRVNALVEGCQFALFIDPGKLDIRELVYGKAGAQHVNAQQIGEGRLMLSWDKPNASTAGTGDYLLKIRARSRVSGPLSEALFLDRRSMMPEAYMHTQNGSLETVDMEIAFEPKILAHPLLYPVVPNPAIGSALLRWNLPHQTEIRVLVRDTWNRTFVAAHQILGPGEHTMELHRSQLPAPGIYFITLEAGTHIFSEKLIFLE